jgi:hypothetical protein
MAFSAEPELGLQELGGSAKALLKGEDRACLCGLFAYGILWACIQQCIVVEYCILGLALVPSD